MKHSFNVEGMKCPMCKAKVEDAIKALAGVNSAEADLSQHNVTVDYDEAAVSPTDFKTAVAAAGRYSLSI